MKTLYLIAGVLVALLALRMYYNGVDRFTVSGEHWDTPNHAPHVQKAEWKETPAGNTVAEYHEVPTA